jgi:hypothetical protein
MRIVRMISFAATPASVAVTGAPRQPGLAHLVCGRRGVSLSRGALRMMECGFHSARLYSQSGRDIRNRHSRGEAQEQDGALSLREGEDGVQSLVVCEVKPNRGHRVRGRRARDEFFVNTTE